MIRNEFLVTDSRLNDWIKETWRLYKNAEFPVCGDYYCTKIDHGILLGKIIDISISHLPKQLLQQLDQLPNHRIKTIIFRAVKEIFCEKYGDELTEKAIRENRIEIILV